jgi:hypothetical protein
LQKLKKGKKMTIKQHSPEWLEAKKSAKKALEKEAQELAKREANKKHRAKINNEALEDIKNCINGMFVGGKDLSYESAKIIVQAIAQGKIRNLKINY